MSMQILDCTLRDGGYINDWKFGRKTIASILDKLSDARVDIIECGFLTGMVKDEESSLFSGIQEIERLLPKKKTSSMFVAMIAMGEKELHPDLLSPYDGKSIKGIRLTFHKGEIDKGIQWAKKIMKKGYLVFMQPVGTVFYTDMELLSLVEKMNDLKPYAFYIVDTLGSMYRNEVSHKFYLIDENMDPEIRLGFHPHNNLQLAFSNAQVLGKIQTKRELIIDSSVFGMGRGAGNLPTELITQYINRNIAAKYDVTRIMDVYDEYIAPIRKNFQWGYAVPYHIAASHVCHPNYASYLLNKQTLTMKDIEKIIQAIPDGRRMLYDQELIRRLYKSFQSRRIDDSQAFFEIKRLVSGRKVLLLTWDKALTLHYKWLMDFINRENPYVAAVNFLDVRFRVNACFITSHKRMDMISGELFHQPQIRVIFTSNVPVEQINGLCIDYDRYRDETWEEGELSGEMACKLFYGCGAKEICLAGFWEERGLQALSKEEQEKIHLLAPFQRRKEHV